MAVCIVCEKEVIEHPFLRNVFYCSNSRCTRLGLLSVYVLEIKEEKKDDKQKLDDPGGGE